MEQIASKVSSANRMHIGVFGRMNVGKSTFVNRLTGQEVSIVSDREGTTTDVVKKPMEINGIGAVLFLDTAGFDDEATELGKQRVAASRKAAAMSDVCVMLFGKEDDIILSCDDIELIGKDTILVRYNDTNLHSEAADLRKRFTLENLFEKSRK